MFVAGACKTKVLLAAALVAQKACPGRLVCLCAATNKVAAELMQEAKQIWAEEKLLHLQVAAGEGGFADSGALWLDRMIMKALPDMADILIS